MANPRTPTARPPAPPKAAPIPEGHVALTAPIGASGVSWDGAQYAVQDGVLVVPKAAAGVLVESHGFAFPEEI